MNIINILSILLNADKEIWSNVKKPQKGDHIRVERNFYYHHGIYISDKQVIHFSGSTSDSILNPKNCSIIMTDLRTFLSKGKLQVKVYTSKDKKILREKDDIVSVAKSMIGKKGYDLILNNCEHFANYCTINKKVSMQIENIKKGKLPNINIPLNIIFFNKLLLYMILYLGIEYLYTSKKNIKKSKRISMRKHIQKNGVKKSNKKYENTIKIKQNYQVKNNESIKILNMTDEYKQKEIYCSKINKNSYKYFYISDDDFI